MVELGRVDGNNFFANSPAEQVEAQKLLEFNKTASNTEIDMGGSDRYTVQLSLNNKNIVNTDDGNGRGTTSKQTAVYNVTFKHIYDDSKSFKTTITMTSSVTSKNAFFRNQILDQESNSQVLDILRIVHTGLTNNLIVLSEKYDLETMSHEEILRGEIKSKLSENKTQVHEITVRDQPVIKKIMLAALDVLGAALSYTGIDKLKDTVSEYKHNMLAQAMDDEYTPSFTAQLPPSPHPKAQNTLTPEQRNLQEEISRSMEDS
jgi:hypothetical protein